jgi:hydrogenase expression/formation protein HypC
MIMCLAIPGRIVEISETGDELLRTARVDFSGVVKNVSLACTPQARMGDFVLVHAGMALDTIDEDEARRTLDLLKELDG